MTVMGGEPIMSDEPTRTSWGVKRHIAADHPAFAGHFVGNPVLPGVVLLAEVLEVALAVPALAAQLGPAPTLASAKFLAPVGPGSDLQVEWWLDARGLNFDVSCQGVPVAKGQFKGQFTRGGPP